MRQQSRVSALLNIRSGEGRLVALVLVYAFLLYTSNVLANTASYALFVDRFGADNLPFTYIGIAVFATLASAAVLKLNQRLPLSAVLIALHVFLLLTLVAYRLALISPAPWVLFSLPIYYGVNNTLTISAFWNLLGRLYNLQQGKRLFGLLSAGEYVAWMITGFAAPLLVAALGTQNLFLIAALAMAGSLGVLVRIIHRYGDSLRDREEDAPSDRTPKPRERLLKDRYIVLIVSLFVLFVVGAYFVNNIFYSQAEVRFASEQELASFLGIFNGVFGALSLVVQVLVASRVLARFGVRAMILATPIGLLVTMIPFVLVGAFSPWMMGLFWLATAANLYRSVLDAVDSAAVNVMYQPLPSRQRTQVQTTVTGIVYPLSIGLTGLVLLLLIDVLNFSSVQLATVLLVILVMWLVTGVLLGREYPLRLQRALRRGRLDDITLAAPDRSTLGVIERALAQPQPGVVLHALNLIESVAPEELPRLMPSLLEHRDPAVRLDALRRIERLEIREALPQVARRLPYEGSYEVQGASLRLLGALGDSDTFALLVPYLGGGHQDLRKGALTGLLRSGEVEGILLAAERLLVGVNAPDPAERALAAQVLGESGITGLYRPVLRLLQDEQPQVQRAALAAAGKLKHPKLWPAVAACLALPELRSAAGAALVAGGEAALPTLGAAFDESGQTPAVQRRIARICGRIGGSEAIMLLCKHLHNVDNQVRTELLAALVRSGYRVEPSAQPAIEAAINDEVEQSTWILACLRDLGDESGVGALKAILTRQGVEQRERIFLWLAFIYNPALVRQVQIGLDETAGNAHSYALEIISVKVAAPLRRLLLPLFDDLTEADRLQQLSAFFPQQRRSQAERIQEIIAGSDAWHTRWTKAGALYAAGQSGLSDLAEAAVASLGARDPLVREAAVWALYTLDPGLAAEGSAAMIGDANPQVARIAMRLRTPQIGGPVMLTTIEKTLLLRHVDFFGHCSEESLVELAVHMQEMEAAAGETFLNKGAAGSSLYLIVAGEVRLHDDAQTVAIVGEGQVLDELALLDPSPRTVAATAISDTQLLRLDREPFLDVLQDHDELAQGMLQLLAQRLRRVTPGRRDSFLDDVLGGLADGFAV